MAKGEAQAEDQAALAARRRVEQQREREQRARERAQPGGTPRWLTAENKFKCPCHGSGFYKTGVNFEGPAPRPLERLRITRAEDGQLLIDKGVKYLYEKGEWTKPGAFLKA